MALEWLPSLAVVLLFLTGITLAGICRSSKRIGNTRLAFTANPGLGAGRLLVLDLIALPFFIRTVTLADTSLAEAWGDGMHPLCYAVGAVGVLALWQPWGLPARWLLFGEVVMRRLLAGLTLLCFCGALPLQFVSNGLRDAAEGGAPLYQALAPYAFCLWAIWIALQHRRPTPAASAILPAPAPSLSGN